MTYRPMSFLRKVFARQKLVTGQQDEWQREPLKGIPPEYLVVDDEHVMADCLTHILNASGYPCVCAYTGWGAIEKARQHNLRFILMDVVMPDISGVEAASVILNEQPACRIVFMTGGVNNEELLKEGFGDGNYILFWKPLHPLFLMQKLEEFGLHPRTPNDNPP